MPVYEYRCSSCEKIFEYQQRMADAPKTECEECQGRLERLISRSAFQFKGGGWYKDLYSSTKPAADGAAKTGSGAASSGSDGAASSGTSSGDAASSGSSSGTSGTSSSGSGSGSASSAAAGPAQ